MLAQESNDLARNPICDGEHAGKDEYQQTDFPWQCGWRVSFAINTSPPWGVVELLQVLVQPDPACAGPEPHETRDGSLYSLADSTTL